MITWFDVETKVSELKLKQNFEENLTEYLYEWIRDLQENDEKDKQIKELTNDVEGLQGEIDTLENQVWDLDNDIEELEEKITKLETKIEELQYEIEDKNKIIETLELKLKDI
jgi:peptidoglycan hydrolase CwlO-like protein